MMASALQSHLSLAVMKKLDSVCQIHEAGHQSSKGSRYVFYTDAGRAVSMMLEKNLTVPNLWVRMADCPAGLADPQSWRVSLASSLWTELNQNGEKKYGRHTAIKAMKELEQADLYCIKVKTLGELERILDALEAQ